MKGILRPGDHVITTSMEHNSVLRPLKTLEKSGIEQSVIRADREGLITAADIEKTIRPNTKLIVVTAASNVTGGRMPLLEIGTLAKKRGILFMVDGAQGAGCMPIDVQRMHIDLLAFPGHKGLLGPLGTGGLYTAPYIALQPLLAGGTGTDSKSRVQPCEFPEGFEAGTINAPGIIGLGYSAEFVSKIGVDVIAQYEEELITYLDDRLDRTPGVVRLRTAGKQENRDYSVQYRRHSCRRGDGTAQRKLRDCSPRRIPLRGAGAQDHRHLGAGRRARQCRPVHD